MTMFALFVAAGSLLAGPTGEGTSKGDNSDVVELDRLEVRARQRDWYYVRAPNVEILTDIEDMREATVIAKYIDEYIHLAQKLFPGVFSSQEIVPKIIFYKSDYKDRAGADMMADRKRGLEKFFNSECDAWLSSYSYLYGLYNNDNSKNVSVYAETMAIFFANGQLVRSKWKPINDKNGVIGIPVDWGVECSRAIIDCYSKNSGMVGRRNLDCFWISVGKQRRWVDQSAWTYPPPWGIGQLFNPSVDDVPFNPMVFEWQLDDAQQNKNLEASTAAPAEATGGKHGAGDVTDGGQKYTFEQLKEMYNKDRTKYRTNYATWLRQGIDLMHYCLVVRPERYRESLARLVFWRQYRAVDEEMFKECFGMSFRQMKSEMYGFYKKVPGAYYGWGPWQLPLPESIRDRPVPEIIYHQAPRAERARIFSEIYKVFWGRADLARNVLLRAAEEEPGVLDNPEFAAEYGLNEFEHGDKAKALELLEKAEAAKVARAEVYRKLSLLRLQKFIEENKVNHVERLTAQQAAGVIDPLFLAHQQRQRNGRTYQLMAEVWQHTDCQAPTVVMETMVKGCGMFPDDVAMLEAVLPVLAKFGMKDKVPGILSLSKKWVFKPEDMERLAGLSKKYSAQ